MSDTRLEVQVEGKQKAVFAKISQGGKLQLPAGTRALLPLLHATFTVLHFRSSMARVLSTSIHAILKLLEKIQLSACGHHPGRTPGMTSSFSHLRPYNQLSCMIISSVSPDSRCTGPVQADIFTKPAACIMASNSRKPYQSAPTLTSRLHLRTQKSMWRVDMFETRIRLGRTLSAFVLKTPVIMSELKCGCGNRDEEGTECLCIVSISVNIFTS